MRPNRCRLIALACASSLSSAAVQAGTAGLTADLVNDRDSRPVLGMDSTGAAVLRAQVLLDRAHFSSGEIDGYFGSRMRTAVAGFQQSRGIAPSARLDAATWAALDADTAPILTEYVLTERDASGPYVAIPDDLMEKAALPALGFTSVEEALGERFHAKPVLLGKLNPGKDLRSAGQALLVPNVAAAVPLARGAKVIIDRSDSTVSLVDEAGAVLAQFPASTGSEHDPLPVGEWKIKGVATNPVFQYNPELFWDADPAHAKATLAPGPNNPSGVVWIDLSKEHYGIHGTPEPGTIGRTQSHGCIRLTNWDAQRLALAVWPGMPATLQE